MTRLSEHNHEILEIVRDFRVVDREQIAALCADSGLSAEGVRTALGRLVTDGYLSRNLRLAHHPRAQIGLARKRIIYYLAQGGRDYFGFQENARKSLTSRVKQLGYYPERLPHAVALSWFHTLLALGHKRKLWNLAWQQGKHTALELEIESTPTERKKKRHTPDAVATLSTFDSFTRYIELELRNKGQMTINHAKFYWNAYEREAIDARVLWVTKSEEKMRALRATIMAAVPQAGSVFVFLCQEQLDLLKPEQLLEPVFLTGGTELASAIPGRKDGQAVA